MISVGYYLLYKTENYKLEQKDFKSENTKIQFALN
jgi:hypothetical protein